MAYQDYATDSSSDEEDYEDAEHFSTIPSAKEGSLSAQDEDSASGCALAHESSPISKMAARAYQVEMLEASLKGNVIVAMDTGSGKTHVAILRIRAELERSQKRVWFLAPTVTLADQQWRVLRRDMASAQSKLLVGANSVDSWSDQHTWDTILHEVRIVVSTYQILLDALKHAFVPLHSLGLIVFDEAHNCLKQNPGARLMHEVYWPAKKQGAQVPHILGLTASPSMGSHLDDLIKLENTLDAICTTPTKHRDELIAQVNRPNMLVVTHQRQGPISTTPALCSLFSAWEQLDIRADPYILHLKQQDTETSRRELRDLLIKQTTYCQEQMKSFCSKSSEICRHLGPWAADYYIKKVITAFLERVERQGECAGGLSGRERRFLADTLRQVDVGSEQAAIFTPKVDRLVDVLRDHDQDPVGIVFVRDRATASVLAHILATHPDLNSRYRVASMAGSSHYRAKTDDLTDLTRKENTTALEKFRSGEKNILVATSVLEEGIDVPACNLVVCFDPPLNVKSFIQRRGRARMQSSQLYLLVNDESSDGVRDWRMLEAKMKKMYQDEARDRRALEELEETEEADYPVLEVESTGARLMLVDAKQHLDHFCSTLSTRKYVDWSPYYIVRDINAERSRPVNRLSLLKATVRLPVTLAPELRQAESIRAWQSEKMARRDAAFQAYQALYHAGLLNDHLLPLKEPDLAIEPDVRPGITMTREPLDPWKRVAQAWRDGKTLNRRRLLISKNDEPVCAEIDMILPVPIPKMDDITLYWDAATRWTIQSQNDDLEMSESEGQDNTDHTLALIRMAFGHRWPVQDQQQAIVRFACCNPSLSVESSIGSEKFSLEAATKGHLIRDRAHQPYQFVTFLPCKPPLELVRRAYRGFEEDPPDIPYVALKSWPKKAGFIHPIKSRPTAENKEGRRLYPRLLPASQVMMDGISAVYPSFGMLIPTLLHVVGVSLLAEDLLTRRLGDVGMRDLSLIVTALCAPAARCATNYENIEFLGDTILKFCTTVNCRGKKPDWPEGHLAAMKDKMVSNARLCKASRAFGLDRYIVTEAFTMNKWRPTYVDDVLGTPSLAAAHRPMATKTLADVVEALIGACVCEDFLEGGIPLALSCIVAFLPDFYLPNEKWMSVDQGRQIVYDKAPSDMPLLPDMEPLERLLGYSFTKKSLLIEAMTHPSYNLPDIHASLDQLEFLGDAVLDFIVVTELFGAQSPPLKHFAMHLLRTALVNADFLGFLVMDWSVPQQRYEVVTSVDTSDDRSRPSCRREGKPTLEKKERQLPLWAFMRHDSEAIVALQSETLERFVALRAHIKTALDSGDRYPWTLMSRLRCPKFFSDVLESVLGAIWVDSGSLEACKEMLMRAGVLPCLRRLVRDGVHVLHPKEELDQLAVDKTVEYVVVENDGDAGEEDDTVFLCKVYVGGELLAEVDDGVTREEARTKAAEQAVRVLMDKRGTRDRA